MSITRDQRLALIDALETGVVPPLYQPCFHTWGLCNWRTLEYPDSHDTLTTAGMLLAEAYRLIISLEADKVEHGSRIRDNAGEEVRDHSSGPLLSTDPAGVG